MSNPKLPIDDDVKILVPASKYVFTEDKRLLIPFTSRELIGFVNQNMNIVVQPKFIMYYGDCYSEKDLLKVAINDVYGFPRANGKVAVYHQPLYGIMNYLGELVIDTTYRSIIRSKSGKVFTVQHKNCFYAVLDLEGKEIVPLGKYDWIDGFDHGLARVIINVDDPSIIGGRSSKYGIINEKGEEVLPVKYDTIWNFYGKNKSTVRIIEGNKVSDIPFSCLNQEESKGSVYRETRASRHYGEFTGSYAQDVMGYSDETINDAFEGDPDAYWNID